MASVIEIGPGKAFDLRIENAKTNADDEPFEYDELTDDITFTITGEDGGEAGGGSFTAIEGVPGAFLAQTTAPEEEGTYTIDATMRRNDAENSRTVYLIVS